MGSGREGDIAVDGVLVDDLLAVLEENLTKLFGALIVGALGGVEVFDVVLHVVEQNGVGAVHLVGLADRSGIAGS